MVGEQVTREESGSGSQGSQDVPASTQGRGKRPKYIVLLGYYSFMMRKNINFVRKLRKERLSRLSEIEERNNLKHIKERILLKIEIQALEGKNGKWFFFRNLSKKELSSIVRHLTEKGLIVEIEKDQKGLYIWVEW